MPSRPPLLGLLLRLLLICTFFTTCAPKQLIPKITHGQSDLVHEDVQEDTYLCNCSQIVQRDTYGSKIAKRAPDPAAGQGWGITRDAVNIHLNIVHYSSIIVLIRDRDGQYGRDNGNTMDPSNHLQVTDNELARIAKDAYDYMGANASAEGIPIQYHPLVVTALQVEDLIYLSSSIKNMPAAGGRNMPFASMFSGSVVARSLESCFCLSCNVNPGYRKKAVRGTHRAVGRCGEPGAVHLFFKDQRFRFFEDDSMRLKPLKELKGLFPRGSRIVTYGKDSNDKEGVQRPCGSAHDEEHRDNWGCQQFIDQFRDALDDSPSIRQINTAVVTKVDHFWTVWTAWWQPTCL